MRGGSDMALKRRKRDEEVLLGDGKTWFRGPVIGLELSGPVYLAHCKKPKWREIHSPVIMAVKSAPISGSGQLQEEREVFKFFEKGRPYIRECFGEEITVGHTGELVYNLLLEHGPGGTMANLMAQTSGRRLSESEVSSYMMSILKGLDHIHKCGFEIYNLEPESILLMPIDDDSVGLGGAKYMAKIGDFRVVVKANTTQIRQGSDIWILGCLVIGMLIGKNPWDCKEIVNFVRKSEGYCNSDDDEFLSCASEEAKDFIECCLGRGAMQKLTAEMLLTHPFLSASRKNKGFNNALCFISDNCELSSSSCSWPEEDSCVMPRIDIKESQEASEGSSSSSPPCIKADGEMHLASTGRSSYQRNRMKLMKCISPGLKIMRLMIKYSPPQLAIN